MPGTEGKGIKDPLCKTGSNEPISQKRILEPFFPQEASAITPSRRSYWVLTNLGNGTGEQRRH